MLLRKEINGVGSEENVNLRLHFHFHLNGQLSLLQKFISKFIEVFVDLSNVINYGLKFT